MKRLGFFTLAGVIALTILGALACSFSTANMSSFKTFKDAGCTKESTSFTTGDTVCANAQVSNNPGKVKVKFALVAKDVNGMIRGDVLKGSEVNVPIDGDGVAKYTVPVSAALLAGTYKLNADMFSENGEKKDGKTADITITQTAGGDEDK